MSEVRYNCPACGDRKRKLYLNPTKKVFICFRCGYKGRGLPQSVGAPDVPAPLVQEEIKDQGELLYEMIDKYPEAITVQAAIRYLVKHHIEPREAAVAYGLRLSGNFLIMPVYINDELVYWQSRSVFAKVFHNPRSQDKPLFWNRNQSGRTLFLVESYMNAVRLDEAVPAVCLFGKFLRDGYAETIVSQGFSRYVICLDSGEDVAAFQIRRTLVQAERQAHVTIYRHTQRGDVCSKSPDTLTQEFALCGVSYKFRRVQHKLSPWHIGDGERPTGDRRSTRSKRRRGRPSLCR